MKLLTVSITMLFAALVSCATLAQQAHAEHHQNAETLAAVEDMTAATVRKIDVEYGKITLKHEAIKSLAMPGMTMVFQIDDKTLFEGLAPGDNVQFQVKKIGTKLVITAIEKTTPSAHKGEQK
jgi:Cu(I)/Ag(I) efflux system protein CusF